MPQPFADENIRRKTLVKLGYDPEKYDYDENFIVFQKPTPQPTAQTVSVPEKPELPESTAVGAFLRGAKDAAGSFVGSVGGGAAGVPLGAALAPFTGGVSAVAVPVVSSLLGSYLGAKAQEAIAPKTPEQQAQTAADYEKNKLSYIAGGLAPLLVTGKPSLEPIKDVGRVLMNPTAVKSVQSMNNLVNQGVNLGTGLGMGVVAPLVRGEGVDYPTALANVVGSALTTSPNKFAQRVLHQAPFEKTAQPPMFEKGTTSPLFEAEKARAAKNAEIARLAQEYVASRKPVGSPLSSIIANVEPNILRNKKGQEKFVVVNPAEESAKNILAAEAAAQRMREAEAAAKFAEMRAANEAGKVPPAALMESIPYRDLKLQLAVSNEEAARLAEMPTIRGPLPKEVGQPDPALQQYVKAAASEEIPFRMDRPSGLRLVREEAAPVVKGEIPFSEKLRLAKEAQIALGEDPLSSLPSVDISLEASRQGLPGIKRATPEKTIPELMPVVEPLWRQQLLDAAGAKSVVKKPVQLPLRSGPEQPAATVQEQRSGAAAAPPSAAASAPELGVSRGAGVAQTEVGRPSVGEAAQTTAPSTVKYSAEKTPAEEVAEAAADAKRVLANRQATWDARQHAKKLAEWHGATLEDVPEIVVAEGAQAGRKRGEMDVALRRGKLADSATADSGYHEVEHQALRDIETSTSDKLGKQLTAQGLKHFGGEEGLVEAVGLRFNEVAQSGEIEKWATQPLKWVAKWFKVKMGTATREDVVDMLVHKMQYDARLVDRVGMPAEFRSKIAASLPSKEIATEKPLEEGVKFQPATEVKEEGAPVYAKEAAPAVAVESEPWLPSVIRSPLASLRKIATAPTRYLAEKFQSFAETKDRYVGEYYNKQREILGKLTAAEDRILNDTLNAERQQQVSLREQLPSQKLQTAYDEIRQLFRDIQKEHNRINKPIIEFDADGRPSPRLMQMDPFYVPNVMDVKILDSLRTNDANAAKLRQEFIDWRVKGGATEAQANEVLDNIIASAHSTGEGSGKYGATSLQEGVGLPPSWRAASLAETLDRYTNRVSHDLARYVNIDSDPVMRRILSGYKIRDPWMKNEPLPTHFAGGEAITPYSDANVQFVMDSVNMKHTYDESMFNAVSRVVKSMLIGPQSKMKDVAANFPLMMQYAGMGQVPGMLKAGIANQAKGLEIALRQGFARRGSSAFQEVVTGTSDTITKLNKTAEFINKIQGAEHLEQYSRGMATAMAEFLVRDNIVRAREGTGRNAEMALKFLKEFSRGEINVKGGGEIPQKLVEEAVVRLAQKVQSTYDFRDLPRWMLETGYLPAVFSLSKWSVAQTNAFLKQAQRDPASVVRGLFGAAVGGLIVSEAVEKVSGGRKLNIPTFEEASHAKDSATAAKLAAYRATALLQYVGYMGIMNDAMKMTMDVAHKNRPMGFQAPAWSVATDLTDKTASAVQAVSSGEDVLEVAARWGFDLAKDNAQLLRILNAQLSPSAKLDIEDKNKIRDLRAFNMTQGNKVADYGNITGNPYTDIEEKKFKKARTWEEAKAALPEAVKAARGKASTMQEREKNLSGLKAMQDRTMPSLEEDPVKFRKYVDFIRDTQGAAKAKEILDAYYKRRGLIKAKQAVVPKY